MVKKKSLNSDSKVSKTILVIGIIIILLGLVFATYTGNAAKKAKAKAQCTEGQQRCSGRTLQECKTNKWETKEVCGNSCRNNACQAAQARTPAAGTSGGACRQTAQRCNAGLSCQNNVCMALPVGSEGTSCANDNNCNAGLKCLDRLCQRKVCTDSDNGVNPTGSSGTLTITRSVSGTRITGTTDVCVEGEDTVVEYSCNENRPEGFNNVDVSCPGGTACQNGACVAVGSANSPCRGAFPNGVCDEGLYCGYDNEQNGICLPITEGARSGRCRADGTCNQGLTCQEGVCYPASPCRGDFPNGMCDDGLYCAYDNNQNGVCLQITPGERSGRCRADGTCNSGLTCQGGVCYPA